MLSAICVQYKFNAVIALLSCVGYCITSAFLRCEPVMSHKMRAEYKELFLSAYQEYLRLHKIVQQVGAEFHEMKELLEKHAPGTEEYQVCNCNCNCMTTILVAVVYAYLKTTVDVGWYTYKYKIKTVHCRSLHCAALAMEPRCITASFYTFHGSKCSVKVSEGNCTFQSYKQ